MEKEIKILEHLLDIQELIGKTSFSKHDIIGILKEADIILKNTVENNEINKDFATKEQRETFDEIMSKITGTKKLDEYPDSIFHMVCDKGYIEQDLKNGNFYIRYSDFWKVFETKFSLNYQETSDLLRGLLEEHLNCNVNTT